ncbi:MULTISPECIES: NAD+ synthase [Providencia]|uniref:Glutamine-dependent NAD(+) synthetase n=2 Tax=Providencia alcalifaciens TaxID=126385 RepID=A0AAW9VDU9_9GAMM|nr:MULTISPECIES: NAD+ synthase [Providencia]ATG16825.1 NAD+ synthase [Providencia alcalifaciens]EEB46249.1 NAD+ synthase [Providencia alcalifaciens DSM 30120]EKT67177.1 NAD synthetase [Providencia alcalifaciens Dmel2]ETT06475.1 NAD+ synthetase [Providencia alcalifaciens F90-2004]EUC93975.1 NAD+ synthetase [Providencia alcalifaciens PAL-2]
MSRKLNISLAQLNWLVGDIEGNCERMLQTVEEQGKNTDIVMFSELALTGYSPEDLLFRHDFEERCTAQLKRLQQASSQCGIIVGHPWYEENEIYNALSFFYQGKLLARYFKQELPNYGVFDEPRYFTAAEKTCVVEFKGYQLGLLICEDIWYDEPIDAVKGAGADLVLTINASPYDLNKEHIRSDLLVEHAQRTGLPIVYLNQVGGQDELVFDGGSKVLANKGKQVYQMVEFAEQVATVTFEDVKLVTEQPKQPEASQIAQVYQALVLATRDYINKNGFNGAILGLSGGIDSGLTVAIAADAIGKDRVQAVMMPFRYTSEMSIHDAKEQAELLGVEFDIVSIEPMFDAFMAQLQPMFEGTQPDTTEENLQARCRAVILMAMSNKRRRLVLTTSNKSESAVGYSTLYGDMAGGFDVLKDVPKTLVFELAKYRNTISPAIPQRVIDRPPSAELAPGQLDQDSLPPYDVLDAILDGYVEKDLSVADLIKLGFDREIVRKVVRLVDINEYKRRQAPVGPRITMRNFGKDRRYPITSGFGRKNWS